MPIITQQRYYNMYEDESGELFDLIMDLKKGWNYKFDGPYEEKDPQRDLLGRWRLEPVVIQPEIFDNEEEIEIDEDGYVNEFWQMLDCVEYQFAKCIPDVLGMVGRVNTNFGLLPCLNCLFYGFGPDHRFERCENCRFLAQDIVLEDYILKVGTWTWSSADSRCDTYEDPCNPGEEYDESLYDDCDFPYNNRRRELFPEPGLDDQDYWSDDNDDNQSV